MDTIGKKRNIKYSVLGEDVVKDLKRYLDAGWFYEFKKRFEKKYGKNSCVAYTTAINVLNGRTKNFKVLELIHILAEENRAIEHSITRLKSQVK